MTVQWVVRKQVKNAYHSTGGCAVSGAQTGKDCVGDLRTSLLVSVQGVVRKQVKIADHFTGDCAVSGSRSGKDCVGGRELSWG